MCLIAWRWQPDAPEPLVLLSNRDEFFNRPARVLHRWRDAPIWAGQDELAGGTWLGAGEAGRIAAVTNFRTVGPVNEKAKSRGHLVRDFLLSSLSASDYASKMAHDVSHYNPFNLWLFDGQQMVGLEGRTSHSQTVALLPGMGSVSNANFNSPWPKQLCLQSRLRDCLTHGNDADDTLLDLLRNDATAPLDQLPQTGISADKELALSAIYVRMPSYGTRVSTLLRMNRRQSKLIERSYSSDMQIRHTVSLVNNLQ